MKLIKCTENVKLLQYTACFRRKLSYFRRIFLRLTYIDITNIPIPEVLTVTGILMRQKCGLLADLHTVPV